MDKQTIKQHLATISQEEVTDVDLMPEIQKQLTKRHSSTRQLLFQIGRVAAVLVVVLMMSAVGYAVWQLNDSPTTIPQDLLTPINQEVTIDGMTVNVDWAYADVHRIAVSWSAVYNRDEVEGGSMLGATLTTADGTEIPPSFGGGGGGGSPFDPIARSSSTLNFDVRLLESIVDTETLDLVLTIRYGSLPNATSGSGGGGGGGGGSSEDAPTPVPMPTVAPQGIPERIFTYEFSVPVLPARQGTVAVDTLTVDGTSISIHDIQVTPSMTIFTICSDTFVDEWMPTILLDTNVPESAHVDDAVARVMPDGERLYAGGIMPMSADDGGCAEAVATAPFTSDTGTMTIYVNSLTRPHETIDEEAVQADISYFD
ncbi:MAG: hypothetical protein AAFQ07_17405, partial [Chloroflexota bacterium]